MDKEHAGRKGRLALYMHATLGGIVIRILGGGIGGIALAWLLTQLLGSSDYGYAQVGLTTVNLLLPLAGLGLGQLVLYRISRLRDEPRVMVGHSFVSMCAIVTALGAGILAVGITLAAFIAVETEVGSATSWLWIGMLAPLLLPRALLTLQQAWLHARQRVPSAMTVGVLPTASSVILLGGFWLYAVESASMQSVVLSILVANFGALVAAYLLQPLPIRKSRVLLSRWERRYALHTMLSRLAANGARWSDVIIASAFLTPVQLSAYAISDRIRTFSGTTYEASRSLLASRIGYKLGGSDSANEAEIRRETHIVQTCGLATVTLVAGVVLVAGESLLSIFDKDFMPYSNLLLVLMAAPMIEVALGANGEYVKMVGLAGWHLIIQIINALLVLSGCIVGGIIFGLWGLAIARVGAGIIVNIMLALLVWHNGRFSAINIWVAIALFLLVVGVMASGFGYMDKGVALSIIIISLVIQILNIPVRQIMRTILS